jgi:chitinase
MPLILKGKNWFFFCGNVYLLLCIFCNSKAQMPPGRILAGYYHNWNTTSAPHVPLDQSHSAYNLLHVAFATPIQGTLYKMEFNPVMYSPTNFKAQIQTVQATGKKVFISLGGGLHPVRMVNLAQKDTFVNTMSAILDYYGFDGIDIDFEGTSLLALGNNLNQPADSGAHYLIRAIRQLMERHRNLYQRKLGLTMAPETAFVQGGMAAYGGIWGAYLPVIQALRDSLDLLQVQLYNSGAMPALNGQNYSAGTADFIVALTESSIRGFQTSGGLFLGLRPQQIAIGLPACPMAAGSGYTDTVTVGAAMRYLLGRGPRTGQYILIQNGGYPQLGGMMTWSIPWDATASCATPYEFAQQFQRIFPVSTSVFGRILYANSVQSPLSNVRMQLMQQGLNVASDTSDFMGNFDLGAVAPGSYGVDYQTTRVWGGVNATDALLTARHFSNISLLNGIHLQAADVNASGTVNATDALMISRRFSNLISNFPAGDWLWENRTLVIGPGGNYQNLVYGALTFGDVNGSYLPSNQ